MQLMTGHGSCTPHECFNMQQHFIQVDRFGQIIVGTRSKSGTFVIQRIFGGHHQDGHERIIFPDFFSEPETVHSRHHDINNCQIRKNPRDLLQGFLTVTGIQCLIAIQFEKGTHHFLERKIIFCNKNGKH